MAIWRGIATIWGPPLFTEFINGQAKHVSDGVLDLPDYHHGPYKQTLTWTYKQESSDFLVIRILKIV